MQISSDNLQNKHLIVHRGKWLGLHLFKLCENSLQTDKGGGLILFMVIRKQTTCSKQLTVFNFSPRTL